MKLRLFLCTTAFLQAIATFAAGNAATDVTNQYVKNPGFDNSSTDGWQVDGEAGSLNADNDCMRFFNGTCHIRQELKGLPKGRYRLSFQGFYRTTWQEQAYERWSTKTENITCFLYAGNAQKKLISIYDASLDYHPEGNAWSPDDGKTYYPDNRVAAKEFLAKGLYWNTLEFEAEGNITIGVICQENEEGNWCIIDNFKLESIIPGGESWIDFTSNALKKAKGYPAADIAEITGLSLEQIEKLHPEML